MNKSQSKYFNTAVKMDKALISLLEVKSFEYITVSEICNKAGVNRSTFYLHYENICDLLDETTKYLFDGFLSYFSADKKSISTNYAQCELEELNFISEEYIIPYLSYIKDNSRVFLTALSHANSFGFDSVFKKMFENVFDPILSRFHYPCEHRKYVMMFYLNGINAIVIEWLKEQCKMPIEEVSKTIHECIFGLNGTMLDQIG